MDTSYMDAPQLEIGPEGTGMVPLVPSVMGRIL